MHSAGPGDSGSRKVSSLSEPFWSSDRLKTSGQTDKSLSLLCLTLVLAQWSSAGSNFSVSTLQNHWGPAAFNDREGTKASFKVNIMSASEQAFSASDLTL